MRCRWWPCCRFLVGAVIAFLGANILRDFGAEIYVVELVSIAFLREFGVLLTAIMLAGRTASAFTAQIGAMKAARKSTRSARWAWTRSTCWCCRACSRC